ncbi:MAG: hypothetical protein Kow0069_37040 [Promethearchaeota archaeon]
MPKDPTNEPQQAPASPLVSLVSIAPHLRVVVERVAAGRRATTRLAHLGVVPGTILVVAARAPAGGPLKIKFRGSYLAIGRGLAEKVLVRPVGAGE